MTQRALRAILYCLSLYFSARELAHTYSNSQREAYECQKEAYLFQKAESGEQLQRLNRDPHD